MPDRLPSDHPTVETIRAHVERHGGGYRLVVPHDTFSTDDATVRIVLEDSIRFARIRNGNEQEQWITGIFASSRGATDPGSGTNRLNQWLEEQNRTTGSSVELDIIESGYYYGLREPGTRTVYTGLKRPSASLSSIAQSIEDN